jgi:hypothetical protein
MTITPPIIVSTPPECAFYRSVDGALAAKVAPDADVYDAHGLRLSISAGGVQPCSVEPDELARLLRRWLGYADAIRESTVSWPLWLLVHASVEHHGYSG